MNDIVVYCDGWIKNGGGCSVAVFFNNKRVFREKFLMEDISNKALKKFVKRTAITVPMGEYFALYSALKVIKRIKILATMPKIFVYMDAELIVEQINDRWEVSNYALQRWHALCKNLMPENVMLLWISRIKLVKILGH